MTPTTIIIAASVLVALGIAFYGTLLALASRLHPERAPDEIYRVKCEDGWVVELARYRAAEGSAKKPPVILCHGVGANSLSLDLAEEISLPRYLRARGYDCWLLDLRGRGGSAAPPPGRSAYDYAFDDHVRYDVKAAIDLVKTETGAPKVAWVGHSMGGMVLYAHAEAFGDEAIQAAVVVGSPVAIKKAPWVAVLARFAKLHKLPALYQILAARLVAPLAGYWTPSLARLIINPDNMAPRAMRIGLARAIANMSDPVVQQLARWMTTKELRSRDGATVFFQKLDRITVPWFAIAGGADKLVPADNVRAGFLGVSSKEKEFFLAAVSEGAVADYGHIDLCLGREAAKDIFSRIAAFLERFPLEKPVAVEKPVVEAPVGAVS